MAFVTQSLTLTRTEYSFPYCPSLKLPRSFLLNLYINRLIHIHCQSLISSPPMDQQVPPGYEGYALGGKIMLGSIVFLLAVVVFITALHFYTRWYLLLLHSRRRERRRGNGNIVIFVDNHHAANRGLEKEVLDSLPFYVYCSKTADASLVECAVCLAEFNENDVLRLLPKCNHSFHIECIDTWFRSNSTCPLCRSSVEQSADPPPVVVEIPEEVRVSPDQTSSSEPDPELREEPSCAGKSLSGGDATPSARKRKVIGESLGLRIEVGRSIETEGPSQSSPGSPFLYLKRFLSMNKQRLPSPAGSVRAIDLDLEGGTHEIRSPKEP